MKNYDISIIIPFLNERENLKILLPKLNEYFSKLNGIKAEVIFVDDGSDDSSSELIKNIQCNLYACRIIKLSRNYGSHCAIRAGIQNCNGEFVTFLYADLQDPLELIESLYKKCKEGYDIVFAYRENSNVSFMEKVFSKLYAKFMILFVAKNFPRNGFDIAMFNRRVRNELNQDIDANSSIFLQLIMLGFKQTSITYNKNIRFTGKSKWTLTKKIKLFIDSFVGFSYMPIYFIRVIGIALSLIGFSWLTYVIIRAIVIKDLKPGWPTLVAILIIGFGITNISLGIIAEYLWRTLDASRRKKAFIINEIIDCNA